MRKENSPIIIIQYLFTLFFFPVVRDGLESHIVSTYFANKKCEEEELRKGVNRVIFLFFIVINN